MLDTLGAVASLEAFEDAMHGVRRGGTIINIGGTAGKLPIDLKWLMDEQMTLIGSVWFSTAEGCELAEMMGARIVDVSLLEHQAYALSDINAAISSVGTGNGGFTNYLVEP